MFNIILTIFLIIAAIWIAAIIIGYILHFVITYGISAQFLSKVGFIKFVKGIWPAMIVAFTTTASAATLPVTIECSNKMGADPEVSSFVLPLGATINMDGTAISYFTLEVVPPLVEDVLSRGKLTRGELDYCVFHQANKFMMTYLRDKAGLNDVNFHNDISSTGNLVSGSVPLAIEQVVKNFGAENLKRVMLAGYGVGLSWAGCIADLSGIWQKKGDDFA